MRLNPIYHLWTTFVLKFWNFWELRATNQNLLSSICELLASNTTNRGMLCHSLIVFLVRFVAIMTAHESEVSSSYGDLITQANITTVSWRRYRIYIRQRLEQLHSASFSLPREVTALKFELVYQMETVRVVWQNRFNFAVAFDQLFLNAKVAYLIIPVFYSAIVKEIRAYFQRFHTDISMRFFAYTKAFCDRIQKNIQKGILAVRKEPRDLNSADQALV